VQHAEAVAISDRGHEQIYGREPVMADSRKLALSVESALPDLLVDVKVGEGEYPVGQVVAVSPAGVPSSRPRAGREGTSRCVRLRERQRSRPRARNWPPVTEPRLGAWVSNRAGVVRRG
jgi:hypothetical protein